MTDLITRQQLAEQIPCALSVIDEARASGRLAYLEGMPWDVAAALLRHISGNALRAAAYRGMNAAKIAK